MTRPAPTPTDPSAKPFPDPVAWPAPTPEMLDDPAFNAIWNAIKSWDVNVPHVYGGYCGAEGNHVRAILDALALAGLRVTPTVTSAEASAIARCDDGTFVTLDAHAGGAHRLGAWGTLTLRFHAAAIGTTTRAYVAETVTPA